MEATTVQFAEMARSLAREARRLGVRPPGFRCPPRLVGVDRTLRRSGDGSVTVAVRLRDRPWPAVVSDMIEGIVAANRLSPPKSDRVRTALWEVAVRAGNLDAPARVA